jgi:hypothetical protein
MTGLDEYARSRLTRSGTDRLPAHLEASYGIAVAAVSPLDLGVFRVDRRDGPSWVARVFPAARPAGAAAGDAVILDFLAGAGFPAERCAAPEPAAWPGSACSATRSRPGRSRNSRPASLQGQRRRSGPGHHPVLAGRATTRS